MENIEKVLNGEYNNPKLDRYMANLLNVSILLSLDMSAYMNVMKLRENIIECDYLEKQFNSNKENDLGL